MKDEAAVTTDETDSANASASIREENQRVVNERAETNAASRRAQSDAAAEAEEAEQKTDAAEDRPALERFLEQPSYKLSFRVDAETDKVVVSVIDRETDDVVRQIPPEELLRLAERLNSSRGGLVRSKA